MPLNSTVSTLKPTRERACGQRAASTDGWDGRDDFTELELVEDGRLSGRVEADHEDAHVALAKEAVEEACKRNPHCSQSVVDGWRRVLCASACWRRVYVQEHRGATVFARSTRRPRLSLK